MTKKTNIDPRYLSYDKVDVERLLGEVDHPDTEPVEGSTRLITSGAVAAAASTRATEASVRAIVTGYGVQGE